MKRLVRINGTVYDREYMEANGVTEANLREQPGYVQLACQPVTDCTGCRHYRDDGSSERCVKRGKIAECGENCTDWYG